MSYYSKLPLISVIVPIYNIESHLERCIFSIINQTYINIEILLINDGSTDKSGEICISFSKIDHRCKTFHTQNKGLANARNLGLKNAKGDYISFIDGDDYISPIMIESLYNAIIKDEYAFSMCIGKQIPQHITSTFITKNETLGYQDVYQAELFTNLYKTSHQEVQYQVVWNKLYKKSILKNVFFKKTSSEDTEFNNRVFLKTSKAIIIKNELYHWVQRENSLTHQLINHYYINRCYSYYLCLCAIPKNNNYQSLCLEKLYKTILNVRFQTRKSQYKNYSIITTKRIYNRTIKKFLNDKNLKSYLKIVLLIFYHIPQLYVLFINTLEYTAIIKKRIFKRLT